MPSHAEGFLAVLEAMSRKAGHRHPGRRRRGSGRGRRHWPARQPGRPADLAAAVGDLLSDPPAAARMGRAARERVLRLFSMPAFVGAIQNVYTDVVSRAA